jgi:hypothetical protein
MTADIASAHSFTLVGLKIVGIEIIQADAHFQFFKSRCMSRVCIASTQADAHFLFCKMGRFSI